MKVVLVVMDCCGTAGCKSNNACVGLLKYSPNCFYSMSHRETLFTALVQTDYAVVSSLASGML